MQAGRGGSQRSTADTRRAAKEARRKKEAQQRAYQSAQLKRLRPQYASSAKRFAETVGLSVQTYSDYENGERLISTEENMNKILNGLHRHPGLKPEDILGGTPPFYAQIVTQPSFMDTTGESPINLSLYSSINVAYFMQIQTGVLPEPNSMTIIAQPSVLFGRVARELPPQIDGVQFPDGTTVITDPRKIAPDPSDYHADQPFIVFIPALGRAICGTISKVRKPSGEFVSILQPRPTDAIVPEPIELHPDDKITHLAIGIFTLFSV